MEEGMLEASKGPEKFGTVIKRFPNGFGFIQGNEHPKKSHNLYFHARDTDDWKKIRVGHKVVFKLSLMTKQVGKQKGLKNRIAVQVKRVE